MNVVSSTSRKEVAEYQAARNAEIERLGAQIANASGSHKLELCSELLAFLGFIHNTPTVRRRWENR